MQKAHDAFSAQVAPPALLRLREGVSDRLQSVALVALQHLLPSVEGLFARLRAAGFSPERTFVLGKPYSSVPMTVQHLCEQRVELFTDRLPAYQGGDYSSYFRSLVKQFWRHAAAAIPADVERVVVLDEGGWLRRDVPASVLDRFHVVGVEHTMSGLFSQPSGCADFPVVLMAASAAKSRFESRVIANAVCERLAEVAPDLQRLQVGVIGLGNLGQAVAAYLYGIGVRQIRGFDTDPSKARGKEWGFLDHAHNIPSLIERCDVVVGCTGRDSLEPARLGQVSGRRLLGSASSGNVEFGRIVKLLHRRSALRLDPFSDARGNINGADVTLLNGGFPINFNREAELEDEVCIRLTRELTFASVMQAALCVDVDDDPAPLMLDAEIQQQLVGRWLQLGQARELFPKWADPGIEWWEKHSQGTPPTRKLCTWLGVA